MATNLTQNALGFGLATVLISSLTGCASTQTIDISTTAVEKPNLTLPSADVIQQRPVEWTLVTRENAEESFTELQDKSKPVVFFGLDEDGYENLSLNISDIRSFIQQQQTIIDAYKNYYIKSEEALNEANQRIEIMNSEIKQLNEKNSEENSWFNLFN